MCACRLEGSIATSSQSSGTERMGTLRLSEYCGKILPMAAPPDRDGRASLPKPRDILRTLS